MKRFKMNLIGDPDVENLDNARMMNVLRNNLLVFFLNLIKALKISDYKYMYRYI